MKIVLTGSSSGIGRALAERLLARGHEVWGLARSDQSDFVAQHGGKFRAARCDVSDWSQISRVSVEVAAAWKWFDAIVTCAGIQGEIGAALLTDPRKWSDTVRANIDGTYFTIRAFADHLVPEPGCGKIVCFSGGGATKPRPCFSAYGIAKTAIVRLVETIAAELKEDGHLIDINALAPGAINTRLTDEVLALGPAVVGVAEFAAAKKQKESGGGSLEKALDCVEWLLSPASDGISGKLISAPWDPWNNLSAHKADLAAGDIYTLRRIVPEERGKKW